MNQEITKCPMCSTKLKMIKGRMTCKDCGYYVRNAESDATVQTTYNAYQADAAQTQANTTAQNRQPYQPISATSTPQGNIKPAKKTSGGKKILSSIASLAGIVIIGVIVGVAKVALRGGLNDLFEDDNRSTIEEIVNQIQSQNTTASASVATSTESSSSESTAKTESTRRIPESDFFREMVEVIWDKAYRTITAEEYASLTALEIDRDAQAIYYQIGTEEPQTLTFLDGSGMDFSDLACFTGLEWLYLDTSLYEGDLDGLNNLYSVYSDNTISEMLEIIPNPENIYELGVEDSIFEDSLAGIEQFKNLEYLTVDYRSLEDISALLSLPYLRELTLIDCNSVTDYSPLMSLTELEHLSIQSNQLKTIDFVKVMPNLISFAVEDSQITKLDALETCTGLTNLYLMDNYNVTDYSVISKLTNLTSLTFSASYDDILPSLAELTQLQDLTMNGVRDISLLKDATNVTYLCMMDCSGWELENITAMAELQTLIINDFASLTESVEPLTHLPKLEILDLSETSIFGNMEEIFGIPTLRQLYLDNCQVGMDFTQIPTNANLEILSMNDIRVLVDPSYNSGVKVNVGEHSDMFNHFPNLKELYAASLQLENIDFVANLPYLQYLDIRNNSVTSLKPLEALSDFRTVWCGQNTILEPLPTDSPIWVITD